MSKTILVVDDLPMNRQCLMAVLGVRRYCFLEASDGVEALALIRAQQPDLIISDILMPLMDGYELVRQLRADPQTASTPVIFYTGAYDEQEVQRLADTGGDVPLIHKPAPAEAIRRQIEAALAEAPKLPLPENWEEFDREHLRLLTDKLAQKVRELEREVEERKRAEDALKASERRFRDLAENIREVFWMAEPGAGQILYASPAYEMIWGRSCDSLYARPISWLEAIHPADRARVRSLQAAQTSGGYDVEYRIVRPDGSIRWIYDRGFPIREENGEVQRIAGIAEDITERRQAQERLRRQFERLTALRAIDVAITSSADLTFTLRLLLDQVTSQLHVDAAAILLLDHPAGTLRSVAVRGFCRDTGPHSTIRLGEGYAGRAAIQQCSVFIPALAEADEPFARADVLGGDEFVSYCAVPLLAKGDVNGVLEIFHRTQLEPESDWLEFLQTLAGQAAIAIDNATLFADLQRTNAELVQAYDATIEGWSRALDLRDEETEGHTQRVTETTIRLARVMGTPENELVHIRRGALLHDIGKMGVPDSILLKPGPLTDDEWGQMRRHPVMAYEMLTPIMFLAPALAIPYCHHEKWDGSGYPRGLHGEQIPLAARIFAVVDVWDALRSDRPYREGWPEKQVIEHIRSLAGTHFDPAVVAVFLQLQRDDATDVPKATWGLT